MKTLMLRVCYLGLAGSTLLLAPGGKEQANADVPDPVADVLKPLEIADVDADADFPAPLAAGETNAPSKPPVMVQEPTPPPNLKLSPALADVVKLVQAGVSPDVLMAYITNSTAVFSIDSDAIVYLNDLGVTNSVITALIQHDSSPATAARRSAAAAVQPLPPGVATTAPVTNVYPPAAVPYRNFPTAGQTTYPGDFSITDTNQVTSELPPAVETAAPATETVTVNYFYSSLAPYGTWMDVEGYGLCWRPTVAVADPYWRPYSHRGRWLWSDCGWYWYSDYSWGWAPFHYGRWCSYPQVGWLWVPGTVWGPSWVTWRYTDSYCGWAPLPPGCGYRSGIGLTWYGRGVSIGFDFGLGSYCYSYVPINRFCDWNVSRHCLPENRLRVVHDSAVNVNRINVRNNAIVNHGIEPNTIAKASRTKIPTMRIKDSALPVDQRVKPERLENNGQAVAVVRPQLPKNAPPMATPAASRGTATRGKPINLSNAGQASTAPAANARPPHATVASPRVNANNPPMSGVRNQGNAARQETVAITRPSPSPRPEAVNRPAPAQPAARQQTPTPNIARQASPKPTVRNNTPAPAVRNSAPPPAVRNSLPPPAGRNVAPAQNQPVARPNPAPRNHAPPIRSFAEPQRSIPIARPTLAPPAARAQIPMATPQPAPRAQFSAPRAEVSRPSVSQSAPVRSAPPATRSAPSGGGGGGGGGRSGGSGKNRGD